MYNDEREWERSQALSTPIVPMLRVTSNSARGAFRAALLMGYSSLSSVIGNLRMRLPVAW